MSEVIRAILNLVLTICLVGIILAGRATTPLQDALGLIGGAAALGWLIMTGWRYYQGRSFVAAVQGDR